MNRNLQEAVVAQDEGLPVRSWLYTNDQLTYYPTVFLGRDCQL